MTINLQAGGAYVPKVLPQARGAEIQVNTQKQLEKPNLADDAAANGKTPDIPKEEKQRYERVAAAAQNYVANLYPVGDKKFSIYKDASGQYITRYVSLIDGKVTVIPEPRLLASGSTSGALPGPVRLDV
jgi:hypothetical protein